MKDNVARETIMLRDRDLKLRDELAEAGKLSMDYDKEMERMHIKNAIALKLIINVLAIQQSKKLVRKQVKQHG